MIRFFYFFFFTECERKEQRKRMKLHTKGRTPSPPSPTTIPFLLRAPLFAFFNFFVSLLKGAAVTMSGLLVLGLFFVPGWPVRVCVRTTQEPPYKRRYPPR